MCKEKVRFNIPYFNMCIKKIIFTSASILLVTLLFAQACSRMSPYSLTTKEKNLVEQYIFSDWDGNSVTVSDFENRIVVIDFWESWCGPCLSAFPGFQRVIDEYPNDIVIIAATVGWQEGRSEALEFMNKNEYDFIFVDGTELANVLGFNGIPYKIILDKDGNVDSVHVGSSGADREYQLLTGKILK